MRIGLMMKRGKTVIADPSGRVHAGPFECDALAGEALKRMRKDQREEADKLALKRAVEGFKMKCLCCHGAVLSEGPHERLCQTCRRHSVDTSCHIIQRKAVRRAGD